MPHQGKTERNAGAEAGPGIPPGNTALGLLALAPSATGQLLLITAPGEQDEREPGHPLLPQLIKRDRIGVSGFLPSHS